ncbi:Gfo/Idh/MocA family protein [Actinocatenispora sera]|uniref:Gfo/Idh/MocA-like oxidoreductase N-terminal domain-containing protein n=1 Tax=Actinocatenispora sera TaxID=390989 RepID=A0A810L104_9ACTN|nr:Gfo/Idh/MocA family oxidoreductase [Actinocatenispora sera]BCJ28156.1 hypothetical protein Asera_22640 [Actinocatenispora sera]
MSAAVRIGLVGTESSHVDHLVRYCNAEHRAGPARVVAVAPATPDEQVRDLGIDRVVGAPEELLGLVDAVVIADRDARRHAGQALPFLTAGLPTLVDKPFAADLADGEAMLAAARRHGAPLTSYSALRWHPALATVTRPEPRAVVTTGPADPASPYAGIHFYGTHPVELALLLAPGEIGPVQVATGDGIVVAHAVVGGTAVTVQFVAPAEQPVPFHVQVTGAAEVVGTALELGPDYLHPGLDAFFAMVRTGTPPVRLDDLLRPVRFLAPVAHHLAAPGSGTASTPVRTPDPVPPRNTAPPRNAAQP